MAPGETLQAADGGDELGVAGGVALDLDDPLRGGGEGVVAQRHGRGAGVVGLAGEGEVQTRLADDGFDDGEEASCGFEHGALLDVDLDARRRCAARAGRWRRCYRG